MSINSIIDQVNELAKTMQANSNAQMQSLKLIRTKLFHVCALASVLLSAIIVIIPHLLGIFHQEILLICAYAMAIGSILNYLIYMRSKNLKRACLIHILISVLIYGGAVFASGGAQSNVIIFAPLLIVTAAILAGKSAVLISTFSLILILVLAEAKHRLAFVEASNSPSFLLINICALLTIAALVYLYEHLQKQGVMSLNALNDALIREKVLNDQIMQALDASAIVAITDISGNIIEANDNFCKISGYSANELIGQNHRIINSGQHSREFFKDLWRTISEGKVWSGEIENRRKDGVSYFVQTVITPLRNQEGKIIRYLSVRFDVTKEREISKQLAEAQRVAKIGSWSYDFHSHQAIWSRQMFDLHEEDATKSAPNFEQYLEYVHTEDRELWRKHLNECFHIAKSCKIRFRIQTKSGRQVWIEARTDIESQKNGKIIKVRGTSQDVTDLVTAEDAIRREQAELKSRQRFLDNVLGNIPSIIFVKDYRNDMRYSLVNRSAEKILGVSGSSLLGKNDFEIFSKKQAEAFYLEDKSVFSKKEIIKIARQPLETPSGQRLLSTTKVPTFDEEGNAELLIGISDDITDEARLKEELETERAKFVQASKLASLGEMSAGIAHEINNPLTIIAGTVRALSKFRTQEQKFEERVQTINKSVDRIHKIVSGLKKYSRTAGSTEMKLHSLGVVVREALVLTNAKLRRNNIKVDFEDRSKEQVWCNEIEIEQVLVNLINNSIDAVKNLDSRWIKIFLFEEGEETLLEVRDSGLLIAKENHEKVFHPFFTTKAVGDGTGLGLAIVKGILDEHDAEIKIRNDLATTSFVIHFKRSNKFKNVA